MRYDNELRELASRQQNLISRRQAREIGVDEVQWRRLLAGSLWAPVTERVIRLAGAAPAGGEQAMAAVLDLGGRTYLSHASAAWWWGIAGFGPRPLHVVRTAPSRAGTSLDVTVHRVRELPASWGTVLNGVPVVRPEVVIMHLCATEARGRAERALDNAWSLRLLSGRSIARFLFELGERGRNGVALLREFLDARGEDYTPPSSNVESRGLQVFSRAGLAMQCQVDLGSDQWTGRVDFRSRQAPVVVEVQSERYHSALLDREADRVRVEKLERDGFIVVEVTDQQVWYQPELVVEKVRAAIRAASVMRDTTQAS